MGEMNWMNRKIHLYNVTMGLYMLDWWERCLFSILLYLLPCSPLTGADMMVLILLWFVCFNGSHFASDVFDRKRRAAAAAAAEEEEEEEEEEKMGEMNWVSRKIHLYNVTMGLYMLDCCSPLTGVDIMVLILLWFICFNGSRFASDVFERYIHIPFSSS
uniref:Uncharacterized protein n=1 Tax=Oryza punctata TaxID=4537 RepID=A0A0E0LK15_ORYPU